MLVREANRENPDQTASSELRSSLIWVCPGFCGRQLFNFFSIYCTIWEDILFGCCLSECQLSQGIKVLTKPNRRDHWQV